MSAEYVRRYYGVDFKRGDRVTLHDHAACPGYDPNDASSNCGKSKYERHGVVVSFPGQYVGVRFDGASHTSKAHPTWHLRKEATDA